MNDRIFPDLMPAAKVMIGNNNWDRATRLEVICVFLFGRVEHFEHMGWSVRIRWWRGKPYLTDFKEPRKRRAS